MTTTFASVAATTSSIDDLNQYAGALNGESGKGKNIQLISLNDSADYVLTVKNLDSAGKAVIFLAADGTVLFQASAAGVLASPAGAAAVAVVTTTDTQTLSGKTVTRLKLVKGANIASAATIASGTDGNYSVITGTTNITGITPTSLSGVPYTFEFASAGCRVTTGTTLRLNGDYYSNVGSTLTLICDGTNWTEIGRARDQTIGADIHRLTNQAITDATDTAISYSTATRVVGSTWVIGSPTRFTPGCTGVFRVAAGTLMETGTNGHRQMWILVNGTKVKRLSYVKQSSSTESQHHIGSGDVSLTAITDYIEILVYQDSAGAKNLIGGASDLWATFLRVGNN